MEHVEPGQAGPRETDAVRRAFSAFCALGVRDMAVFLRDASAYYEARTGRPSPVAEHVLLEGETFGWLDKAAALLGLPPGVPPTYERYCEVYGQIEGAPSGSSLARRAGSWKLLVDGYRNRRLAESARQFAGRRKVMGRKRTHEEYIDGVRLFEERDFASRFQADYNRFVDEWNAALSPGEKPLVQFGTIRQQLGISFEEARACARGETTVEQVLAARRTPRGGRADSGPLVGVGGVAMTLGYGRTSAVLHRALREPGFPPPVAHFRSRRLWLRSDVEAYRAGTYDGRRKRDELQEAVVFSPELCRILALAPGALSAYLCSDPERVPEPSGRAGGSYWWRRSEVEQWIADHPRPKRRHTRSPIPAALS